MVSAGVVLEEREERAHAKKRSAWLSAFGIFTNAKSTPTQLLLSLYDQMRTFWILDSACQELSKTSSFDSKDLILTELHFAWGLCGNLILLVKFQITGALPPVKLNST